MSVTATIVCSFGGGAGQSMLIAEFDDVKNNDKTTFLTSETAFFSIFKYPSTLLVSTPVPTSGMITPAGSVSKTHTEQLEFVNTQSVSLAYPPSGAVTLNRWYGNIGQDFAVSGFTANISSTSPCICEVTYPVVGVSWQLHPPAGINLTETPEWPIVVFIQGEDI